LAGVVGAGGVVGVAGAGLAQAGNSKINIRVRIIRAYHFFIDFLLTLYRFI
jgi:hypothetical protein